MQLSHRKTSYSICYTTGNLFTAVFVLNPLTAQSLIVMALLQRVIMQGIPLRVGVIFQTESKRLVVCVGAW